MRSFPHVAKNREPVTPNESQGPPKKNGVQADSIIAKPGISNGQTSGIQSHLEVVTFDPAQAYPEFIVRFREE